ncbi:ankyrin repeat protein [Seminavis robusta]|uniref:Ankyrin repeat protein n=1 Tax=Seminavis robusta TaxID=568900 RepID=A0A9N8EC27_9STRA|nr:ankyrin repeat protein [Seminavis robusta]|eukprot:Sro951_g223950.1 ankyrin repeat protein (386) ;mRNA; r:28892-30049
MAFVAAAIYQRRRRHRRLEDEKKKKKEMDLSLKDHANNASQSLQTALRRISHGAQDLQLPLFGQNSNHAPVRDHSRRRATRANMRRAQSSGEDFDLALSLCQNALLRMHQEGEDEEMIEQKLNAVTQMVEQFREGDALSDFSDTEVEEEEEETEADRTPILLLNDQTDIWVNNVLPFVGMGNYVYVAGVNKHMKQVYEAYCASVETPPQVTAPFIREATVYDTFYSSVFSGISCAQFWDQETREDDNRLNLVCTVVAKVGNLDVFKWAHEQQFPWNERTCEQAAANGHVKILEYAHKNGCPWDSDTCSSAAKHGQFKALKYACDQGCPWDAMTCAFAAQNGHLEALKWVRSKGCPWDGNTYSYAASNGHWHVLKWARQNGVPGMP